MKSKQVATLFGLTAVALSAFFTYNYEAAIFLPLALPGLFVSTIACYAVTCKSEAGALLIAYGVNAGLYFGFTWLAVVLISAARRRSRSRTT